jgi:UDP-N-acetylglucosamine 2-epimerase (non-hydrolysing)
VAALVLDRRGQVIAAEKPDWVLVQGDTTTTAAAALAASYSGVKVGHVEAGLRTFDRTQPFPEEINRLAVSAIADLHFAPTPLARMNLLREGVSPDRVIVTGNSGIDALLYAVEHLDPRRDGLPWRHVPRHVRVVLATAHRRENLGSPLREICAALGEIAELHGDGVRILFPLHPRPDARPIVESILGRRANVILCEPLDYHGMVQSLLRCEFLLTDSGGLQEEAPYLGKPVLVLRNVSERPEGVHGGTARLIGVSRDAIVREASRLLNCAETRARMSRRIPYYGDGRAADRIVAALLNEPVSEWLPPDTREEAQE